MGTRDQAALAIAVPEAACTLALTVGCTQGREEASTLDQEEAYTQGLKAACMQDLAGVYILGPEGAFTAGRAAESTLGPLPPVQTLIEVLGAPASRAPWMTAG